MRRIRALRDDTDRWHATWDSSDYEERNISFGESWTYTNCSQEIIIHKYTLEQQVNMINVKNVCDSLSIKSYPYDIGLEPL